jgi:hypothetical protein
MNLPNYKSKSKDKEKEEEGEKKRALYILLVCFSLALT